jgi:hypothetical protein
MCTTPHLAEEKCSSGRCCCILGTHRVTTGRSSPLYGHLGRFMWALPDAPGDKPLFVRALPCPGAAQARIRTPNSVQLLDQLAACGLRPRRARAQKKRPNGAWHLIPSATSQVRRKVQPRQHTITATADGCCGSGCAAVYLRTTKAGPS